MPDQIWNVGQTELDRLDAGLVTDAIHQLFPGTY